MNGISFFNFLGRVHLRWWSASLVMMAALLGGCASTVTSEVTAFRQSGWNNDAPRTYAFETVVTNASDLERGTYQGWIGQELRAHGFNEVSRSQARYVVKFEYDATPRTVQVREMVYPEPYLPGPFYRPWPGHWGPYGPWGWPGQWPPYVVERDIHVTQHALRVMLTEARGGQRVYQVTALHETMSGMNPAAVMPYLVRSAFAEFPASHGQPRQVTLPVQK
jgi:hypothetical protein